MPFVRRAGTPSWQHPTRRQLRERLRRSLLAGPGRSATLRRRERVARSRRARHRRAFRLPGCPPDAPRTSARDTHQPGSSGFQPGWSPTREPPGDLRHERLPRQPYAAFLGCPRVCRYCGLRPMSLRQTAVCFQSAGAAGGPKDPYHSSDPPSPNSSPGSTCVFSWRTACKARGRRPSARSIVGAICVVDTGASTVRAITPGADTISAT